MKLQRLLHFRTNIKDKLPSANDIELGEIAINYATDGETLFIKNDSNKIAEFKDTKYYSGITNDIYSKLDTIDTTIEENELVTAAHINDLNDRETKLNQRVTLVENGEIENPFFKSFATLAEYETAVANKEVVYPCVSYITEDNVIKFEKLLLTNKAIVTVTQRLIDEIGHLNVKPLTFNPNYYEIFEINGEDYLSNVAISDEGQNVIPFPSFNLGDTFNIKFKLKDEPQYFIENGNGNGEFEYFLFYLNLSYLEIDESFYKRLITKMDILREQPVGFYIPSFGPDFTCKFKGNYGTTDKVVSITMLTYLIYGLVMAAENDTSTQIYGRLQIPSGNETYGNPSDMYNVDTKAGATFYGIINYLAQDYGSTHSNLHIIIETY